MAYDNNTSEVLADITKGARGDVIRVAKLTNKVNGTISGDIRLYYTNDDGELAPTKKGCRFNAEIAPDIVKALLPLLTVDELDDIAATISDMLSEDDNDETE